MKNDSANIQKLWFCSDLHINHNNILKYQGRPFENIKEMNDYFVQKWNEYVSQYDDVYFIGDFAFGKPEDATDYLYALNGRIFLITGNHEKAVLKSRKNRNRFALIRDKFELNVRDEAFGNKPFIIYLHHYACRVWNKSHHGAWHLYGHSHDSLEHEVWGKSMDVGIDSSKRILGEYRPFHYNEIKEILSKRPIKEIDHHKSNR